MSGWYYGGGQNGGNLSMNRNQSLNWAAHVIKKIFALPCSVLEKWVIFVLFLVSGLSPICRLPGERQLVEDGRSRGTKKTGEGST